jgi:CBS domain-containing protein
LPGSLRCGLAEKDVTVRFPPSPLFDRREKMQIKDRPEYARKGAVLTMTADASVASAVTVMSEKNYGAVVIVSADEKPIGIVTERDFMRRLLAKGLDPTRTTLGEIMTDDLKVAKPEDELLDWLRQMSNDRFRHVPVVGEDGRVITMMSQGDFVSYTWPQLFARLTEQAKATFELSPSMFAAFGGATLFFLAVIAFILATS